MTIYYKKKFLKDLSRIPSTNRKEMEAFVFNELPLKKKFNEIDNAEKMTGYSGYYKIRFGDYRMDYIMKKIHLHLKGFYIEKKYTGIFHK